jgi:hypothetical protein
MSHSATEPNCLNCGAELQGQLARLVVPKPVAAPLILSTIPYDFIALRRVFGGSRAVTFGKGLAIGVLYWAIALSAVMAVAFSILVSL